MNELGKQVAANLYLKLTTFGRFVPVAKGRECVKTLDPVSIFKAERLSGFVT